MRILVFLFLMVPSCILAAGSSAPIPLDSVAPDLSDKASLQRGARTYVNYCLGCHAMKYQRFQRVAEDLGISQETMMANFVFDPSKKFGSHMENSMSVENAKQWFGNVPPDLTLYTKLKGGPDYFYTYMRSFYEDSTRPFGVNNLLYENVGMPHPLVHLQGVQRKVCKNVPKIAKNGGEMRDPLSGESIIEERCGDDLLVRGISPLSLVEGSGELSADSYDGLIYDLTNFLYYSGDPSRLERERLGGFVLLFLAFFYVFAWLLGREYLKEFH
ncbi:MAG: cytochrome c1 [Gammaproteobacteria bacterium]|nr:cytochrome c1 [Gammaproteobacteria bacterium]